MVDFIPRKDPAPQAEAAQRDDGVEQLDGGRIRIRLQWPVTEGDRRIDSLVLRRPRGVDMKRMPTAAQMESEPYKALQFVAGLFENAPPEVADLLDFEDIQTVNEASARFFLSGPPTGRVG